MATKKKNSLYVSLTTVTPLSKAIAFLLFIIMPFIGFYLGMEYQKTMDSVTSIPVSISQTQAK